jgi:hypothetical protein
MGISVANSAITTLFAAAMLFACGFYFFFQQLGLGLRLLAKRTRRRFAEHQINLGFYLFYLFQTNKAMDIQPQIGWPSAPLNKVICARKKH